MKLNLAAILATIMAATVTAAPAHEALKITNRGKSRWNPCCPKAYLY